MSRRGETERSTSCWIERAPVAGRLGAIGFNAALRVLETHDVPIPRPGPKFGHNALYKIGSDSGERDYTLISTYHPSRQNTNTGKLTAPMFDAVFQNARRILTKDQ